MDIEALDDWARALMHWSCGHEESFDEVGAVTTADSDPKLDETVPMEVDESPVVDPDSLSTTQARYVWERPLEDLGGEDLDMLEEPESLQKLKETKDTSTTYVDVKAPTKHYVHWWDGWTNEEDSAKEEKDVGFGVEYEPEEFLEDLKIELRALLERTGDAQHRKSIMKEL